MAEKNIKAVKDEAIIEEPKVLTQEVIDKLKAENPRGIYKVVVMDDTFIVKTLDRTEYVNISESQETNIIEKEEIITQTCVVWPKLTLDEVKALSAGVPTTIAEQVMARSGFEAVSVEKL